jgi:hypothetical protein
MPELQGGVDTAVFVATFKLADVAWTSTVEPAEASAAGCIAFPTSGTTAANGSLELLAVAKDGFEFDHWERNGASLSENELATVEVAPLAEGEQACVFKAVFRAE